jgi:hypothetical protein
MVDRPCIRRWSIVHGPWRLTQGPVIQVYELKPITKNLLCRTRPWTMDHGPKNLFQPIPRINTPQQLMPQGVQEITIIQA